MKVSEAFVKSLVYRVLSWGMAFTLFYIGLGKPPYAVLGFLVAAVEVCKGMLYLGFEVWWPNIRPHLVRANASGQPP